MASHNPVQSCAIDDLVQSRDPLWFLSTLPILGFCYAADGFLC